MVKKLIFLLSLIFLVSLPQVSFATHGMGGEITWDCLGNGQYKFRMKFYRDCNGIGMPGSVDMATTVPGRPIITLFLVSQQDISPNGFFSNGTTPCADCINGNQQSPIQGLVEEFIYESNPTTLNGVPPATGWVFSWGTCCRSSFLTNITNPGTKGFANRAIMYPYNGQNANPCFDSSPYFAEKPSTIICTGYPFKYNHNAVDRELDSLVYSWASPIDDNLNTLGFAPGYSVTSQLPSPTQNVNNVAATINANTGEVNYTSFTGGYFVTVVKVAAYKCGIKVAEIFREINVVLNNNCPPIAWGLQNAPPTVYPPFIDPATGLQTSFIDTVYAGDTVRFQLDVTDFNFFTGGQSQLITMSATGNEFGVPITNQTGGCPITPCATLTTNVPQTFPVAGNLNFYWRVNCRHVEGYDTLCARQKNTYNFVFKSSDNYCPANATSYSTITIVVLPPPKLDSPKLRCLSVNEDGSVNLNWIKPFDKDTQNTFYNYQIYYSTNQNGPYTIVDSIFNPNTLSYTHTGINAQSQPLYYYLLTRSGCNGDSISTETDTLSTIYLNSSLGVNNNDTLTWNNPITPLLSTHIQKYYIYKQYPIGSSWILLDSTNVTNLVDTTNGNLCEAEIAYKVVMYDSSGCGLISSIDTIRWDNNFIADIYPSDTMICDGDSVTITTDPGYSYLWNTGQVSQSIVVYNPDVYSVILTNSYNCKDTLYSTIVVNDLPNPPTILGNQPFCIGDSTTLSTSLVYPNYQWSNGSTLPTITIYDQSTYTLTITDNNGCSSTDSIISFVNPLPVFNITGINELCFPDSSLIRCSNIYPTYVWNNGQSTQSIYVSTTGNYSLIVTDNNGCSDTSDFNFISRPLPIVSFTNDTSISCSKTTIQFTNTSISEPNSTYFWNLGNGTTSTLPNPNVQYVDTGYYNVQLVVISPYGCKDSASNQVYAIFYPLPIANFTTDDFITNIVDQRIYFTDLSQNATKWYWSFGDDNFSNIQNPYHDYENEGEYSVKLVIENISGCKDSTTKKVMIVQIFTPNSFTPNNDGINDYFYTHSEGIPDFQYLRVWNKWGNLVFESNAMSKVWDGYDLNGKPAPEDVYVYEIKYVTRMNKDIILKGQFSLVR
jgi:gliding motility-associated-like protein